LWLFVFAFFTRAATPLFAAHWSATAPRVRSEIKNRASGFPFALSATVTVLAFAGFSMRSRARLAVSPTSEASSKQQGDGQRFQKKAMKTTKKKNEASAPANVRPSSVSKTSAAGETASGKTSRLPIDFDLRFQNRALNTENLLALLRRETPSFFEVAEVVGKWVWIQFKEIPAAEIRQQLAQLGFHWNNTRQAWQHPCGTVAIEPANYDPRKRYGSYFAADRLAA